METLIYILKVNLYCTLFYLCYWLLLRRHTFFKLNRFYLIGTLLLSMTLPFIQFTETVVLMPSLTEELSEPSVLMTPVREKIDWVQILMIVYGIGFCYMISKLLTGFYRLHLLLKQGERINLEGYILILLPETGQQPSKLGSFSFFNFLVVSNYDYENYFDTILQHETVHIKQGHSFDILIAEILKAAFWFNPVIWFYKYSLQEVHEFLADHQAESKDSYASFLVSYAQNAAFESLSNNFFNSFLLKNRIRMIYCKSSSYWSISKYLVIVPIIGFTVLKTAAHNQIYIKAIPTVDLSDSTRIENPQNDQAPDSLLKNKKKKLVTYKSNSSIKKIRKNGFQSKEAENNEFREIYRVSKFQDTLWEAYDPNPGQINYYNRAKIKRIKPFFPALEKLSKNFGNSVDLSKKETPKTELQHFTLITRQIDFYPTSIKKMIP